MLMCLLSKLVTMFFGLLYPAYASYLVVKTKDVRGYVKWMMYWIVFAFYTAGEVFTDMILAPWFPFYYELKICILLWLMSPMTAGAGLIYRRLVHPELIRREPEIEEAIAAVTSQTSVVIGEWVGRCIKITAVIATEILRKCILRQAEVEYGTMPDFPQQQQN